MKESGRNSNFWQTLGRELLFFGAVILFLGISVVHFSGKKKDILSSPTVKAEMNSPAVAPTSASASASASTSTSASASENRMPASIQTQNPSTSSFPLGCWKAIETKKMETSALLVQLQWEKCEQPKTRSSAYRAKNRSTGEELLLLENTKGFFTHYFPVKEGINEIVIESGSESRSLEIHRN